MNSMAIRQVTPEDKTKMIAISSTIWDGSDYIPYIADYWISGENGVTLGIELDHELLGFARMTFLSDQCCWLEGIRVDEKARGLGLGKALTQAMVSLAKEKGYAHIELSSFVENYESLGIVKKKGFTEKASFKYYEYPLATGQTHIPQFSDLGVQMNEVVVSDDDAFEALYQRILASEGYKTRQGYFSYDWTFKTFDRKDLLALIEIGGLYELCWQVESSWLNQMPRCSLMALSNRYAKGQYETLHWVENPEFVEVSLNIATRRAGVLGQSFNVMLPVSESVYATGIDGLESLSEEEEDVFVFYYNK